MATSLSPADPTARILGPDGRPWQSDAPDGIKVPHVWTFGSLVNSFSKSYSWRWDEAMKQSRETALAMRRDCFLMGLLRERQLPTEQMKWHIEGESKTDARQVEEAAFLEKVIRRTPYLHRYKRACGEAIWYGRAGPQQALTWDEVEGERAVVISDHLPVNGDKIQFDWDGTPKIRLYAGASEAITRAGGNVQIGDVGPVLKLDRPYWRSRFVIHKHDVLDADFLDTDSAGQVGGIGIRDYIYWMNWIKLEFMSWLTDFMERTGLGLTIYYYDAASSNGEATAREMAKKDGRNTAIVYPRGADGADMGPGVDRIETSTSGADFILEAIERMFDNKIERFIIGQTMSSRQEGGGLGGSHAAEFQANTKYRIIKSDCENLGETLTEQCVMVLKKLNPKTANSPYHYKWVFNVDEFNPMAKLEAAKIAYEMGVDLDADEVREPTGFSKPNEDSTTLKQPDPMEMLEAKAKLKPQPGAKPGSNGAKGATPKKPVKKQNYSRNGHDFGQNGANGDHNGDAPRNRLNLEFYKDLHQEQKSFLTKVLDTVRAGEKRIEKAVKTFFGRVWSKVKRVVDAAFGKMTAASEPTVPSTPETTQPPVLAKKLPPASPEDVKAIAETVAETIDVEELKEEIKPALERLHTAGSLLELDDNVRTRVGAYSGREVWTTKFSTMRRKLPEELKTAASEFLDTTFQQPWWESLPGDVGAQLAGTLTKGTFEGETLEGLVARLQNAYAELTTARAKLIGRTESTGALNAGLQAARVEQYRKGLVKGKAWQDMDDEDVRPDHDEDKISAVGVLEDFTVGGELCQYPGDQRLSAKQRCQCRCIARSIPVEAPSEPYQRSLFPETYGEEGHWVTINGAHVFIGKGGKIEKGPPALVGKERHEVPEHGLRKYNTNHAHDEIRSLLDNIGKGTTSTHLSEALDKIKTLPKEQIDSLLAQLNIHGKVGSKSEALRRIHAVVDQQMTMDVKAEEFRHDKQFSYVPHSNQRPDETTVMVDPAKLDQSWQKEIGFYIPKGGEAVKGRRKGFEDFLATGKPIEAARAVLHEGEVSFIDGRHRFSVLRDKGASHVALTVPKEQAGEFKKRFGALTRETMKT